MTFYAYRVEHVETGRFYIGIRGSRGAPEDDVGYLGSGAHIRSLVAQHGPQAFRKVVLETFNSRDEASRYEKDVVTIDLLANPRCLNLVAGGGGCGVSTCSKTEETKARMRAAWVLRKASGWKMPMASIERAAAKRRGRKIDPSVVEKTASKLRGRPRPANAVEAVRRAHIGAVRSQETRALLSAAHVGRKWGPDVVERRAASMRGRRKSDAVRANMVAGWVRRKANGSALCNSNR